MNAEQAAVLNQKLNAFNDLTRRIKNLENGLEQGRKIAAIMITFGPRFEIHYHNGNGMSSVCWADALADKSEEIRNALLGVLEDALEASIMKRDAL